MRSVNFTSRNMVTLLHCGNEFFPALIAAIEVAVIEIYLETYIFSDDETGSAIKAALQRAAARGVAVNVMTDWIGTGRLRVNALQQELAATQVNLRIFNPWFRRGVARSHRKMCVVDRHLAFVGGINLNDDLRDDNDGHLRLPAPRWDFAVQVRGPLVDTIHA